MDKHRILQYQSDFDKIAHFINNEDNSEQVEVWFARELQILLGYARWENFIIAIYRAVDSCKTQGINIDDHFREVTKMVDLGSGAKRKVTENNLSRSKMCKRTKWFEINCRRIERISSDWFSMEKLLLPLRSNRTGKVESRKAQ